MPAAVIGSPRKGRLCKNRKGQVGRLRRSDHQQCLLLGVVISFVIITCLYTSPIILHTFEPPSTSNWSRSFASVHKVCNLAFTDGLALGAYPGTYFVHRHAYSIFGPSTRNHHLALLCGVNVNMKRRHHPLYAVDIIAT